MAILILKCATQASKLSTEDCVACIDLLEVLLVGHCDRFEFIYVAKPLHYYFLCSVLEKFQLGFVNGYMLFILQSVGHLFSQITITGKSVCAS